MDKSVLRSFDNGEIPPSERCAGAGGEVRGIGRVSLPRKESRGE